MVILDVRAQRAVPQHDIIDPSRSCRPDRPTAGILVWHRNYNERIFRDECEMNHIREYITMNLAQWADDENYPASLLA